jgi:hypothetical protein
MAKSLKERQTTDSAQGGEGTRAVRGRGWNPGPLTKSIGSLGNTKAPMPPKTQGTK